MIMPHPDDEDARLLLTRDGAPVPIAIRFAIDSRGAVAAEHLLRSELLVAVVTGVVTAAELE